ncbi:MAG TPA: hypothetical protein VFU07_02730 [Candidatus Lumbricidophila sp.]|nr:hypothetical protein [Candidatus Lumbricidophila sp.]
MDIEKQYVLTKPSPLVRVLASAVAVVGGGYGLLTVIEKFSPWMGAALGSAAYLPISVPTDRLAIPASNATPAEVAAPITWVETWATLPSSAFGMFIAHTWLITLSVLALTIIGVWLCVRLARGRATWANTATLVGVAGGILFVSSVAGQLLFRQVSDAASSALVGTGWLEPGFFALLDGGPVLVALLLIVAAVVMRAVARHAAASEGVV